MASVTGNITALPAPAPRDTTAADFPSDPEAAIPASGLAAQAEMIACDLRVLSSVAVAAAVAITLSVAREILVPIALAILLSFVLAPVVRLLRRLRLPRVPAVFMAVILALATILSVGGLIGMQMSQLLGSFPRYASTIDQKVVSARTSLMAQATTMMRAIDRQLPLATALPPPGPHQPAQSDANKPVPVEVQQPAVTPLALAERVLTPVASPLATTAAVFVVAIFILLQQADLRDRMIRLLGLQDLYRTTRAIDDAVRRLSRYLLTQLGLNTLFGIVIWLGLVVIGVPNPLLWGTLSTLFRFLPYIGSALAALLPVALAAAVVPGWNLAIETASLFAVTEAVMGQFIEPMIYGQSTGLSPLSVVVAALFWTWMWGPIGLLLSMPLTLCLVVLGRHVPRLQFLDVLMGNRPALTAVESFYQRILADDPDEALASAELLLRNQSLSSYYDDVALRGLQLAANDVERGVLGATYLKRIRAAMAHLITALDKVADTAPADGAAGSTSADHAKSPVVRVAAETAAGAAPPAAKSTALAGIWAAPAPVLCVAGGGPFDSLATDMLAQLLTRNGLGTQVVASAAALRSGIDTLDFSSIALVCICDLNISFNPTQLRATVRRIRQRAPHAPILAGLWMSEDQPANIQRLQSAIGADRYASSLCEAVAAALSLARTGSQTKVAAAALP
jgi:predicted PurR-regulated permease PerM